MRTIRHHVVARAILEMEIPGFNLEPKLRDARTDCGIYIITTFVVYSSNAYPGVILAQTPRRPN